MHYEKPRNKLFHLYKVDCNDLKKMEKRHGKMIYFKDFNILLLIESFTQRLDTILLY